MGMSRTEGERGIRAKTLKSSKQGEMHFLYRHCGLISYLYLVNSLDSDFMSYLTEEPGLLLCPGVSSDPPAALAHRVGQIIVRNPLHGTFLVFSAIVR